MFAVTVYVELELEGETLQEGAVDLNVYRFKVFWSLFLLCKTS